MGRTDEAKKTIRILRLNDPAVCHHRRRAFVVRDLEREAPDNLAVHELFVQIFGYPTTFPTCGGSDHHMGTRRREARMTVTPFAGNAAG